MGKKMFLLFAIAAFAVGVAGVAFGAWGIFYTYSNTVSEHIITPDDAAIPGKPVRGPLTLKVQADTIRKHTLRMTGGKTFAEMPRMVPKTDESGQPVLDENGNPVMVPNEARDIWITATTLITALRLGIMAYMLGAFVVLFGLISLATGFAFLAIRKRLSAP
jgi:purine-cytosine permease-like protein